MEFSAPAWIAAGALAALVPLALHLVVRRPPERRALPTLRFLRRDARSSVRVRRRPSDVPLLLLRMLLLLLLGAALAGPRWVPERGGTATVVLLDRGGWGPEDGWRGAVDAARARLLGEDGAAGGALVIFDTAATVVPPAALTVETFDSLDAAPPVVSSSSDASSSPSPSAEATSTPSRYAAAFRGLRAALPSLRGVDSVRVALVSVPRRGAWGPGTAALRAEAWPGRVEVETEIVPAARTPSPALPRERGRERSSRETDSLASASTPAPDLSPDAGGRESDTTAASPWGTAAIVVAGEGEGRFVAAALEAVGWSVARAASSDARPSDVPDLVVLVDGVDPAVAVRWLDLASDGAAVLAPADVAGGMAGAPWVGGGGEDGEESTGTMRLAGGAEGRGAVRLPGSPAEEARVVAAWEDGRPAAATTPVGEGCVVAVGARLEAGALPLDPSFPRLLDALARTCDAGRAGGAADALPLDAGALALLRGDGRPEAMPLADVLGPADADAGGIPLGRWLLAAVLLVAAVEGWMAYGRRGGAVDGRPGDDAAPPADRTVREANVAARR